MYQQFRLVMVWECVQSDVQQLCDVLRSIWTKPVSTLNWCCSEGRRKSNPVLVRCTVPLERPVSVWCFSRPLTTLHNGGHIHPFTLTHIHAPLFYCTHTLTLPWDVEGKLRFSFLPKDQRNPNTDILIGGWPALPTGPVVNGIRARNFTHLAALRGSSEHLSSVCVWAFFPFTTQAAF